jgi:hypothetical protein
MFDTELKFFISHQDELVQQYRGQTLVIRGESVVGVYPTPLKAYLAAQERFELGTFMIQRCEPGPEAYTVTINLTQAGGR